MKQQNLILVIFLTFGFALIYYLFSSTENSPVMVASTNSLSAADSLKKGYAVFWPSKNAYFRIKNRSWEYSSNYLNSPFKPLATDEIIKELNDRYNQTCYLLSEIQSELPSQQENVNPEPTPEEKTPFGKTVIAYKNNKYRIAKEVLTDKGLEHTNGDSYRFLNQSKWELKRKGSNQWSPVEEKDINFFLSVNAKKNEGRNPPPQEPIALIGIALNKTSLNLTVGGTAQLSVSFTPANANNATTTWKSSNEQVAIVSTSGKITAKKQGSVTIKVSSGSLSKECNVQVAAAVVGLPENEKIILGEYIDFSNNNKVKSRFKHLTEEQKKKITINLKSTIQSTEGKKIIEKLSSL